LGHPLSAAEYTVHPDVSLRDHFGFGGGRRVCPGVHVAENSIFINVARTLWGFNIEHARDADGNIIPVDFTTKAFVSGALAIPKPFKCGTIWLYYFS
jgi:cytochrome P450